MNSQTMNTQATISNPVSKDLSGTAQCFHCGLPLPKSASWSVQIDGLMRPMCCPGCEAVAQAIVDNHFSDYYRNRTEFSAQAGQSVDVPPELLLIDSADASKEYAVDGVTSSATFSVEGIRCAACVWLIERHLAKLPGVQRADMNVATEKLFVQWCSETCKPSDILSALHQIGYAAYPFDPKRHGEQLRRGAKILFRQLFIAGLSMMQVMMYAVPLYLATDGTMDKEMASLMRWAGLMLTLPALLYSARPFFVGAWSNLKQRVLGMDVPVALGIAAAFIGSTMATLRGEGEVYFDSITMFIFLLLCSRYLELSARRKAACTLESLQDGMPASASRLTAYPESHTTETIAASALCEGDFILVKPGEALAADGVIAEGDSCFDVSLLTGESRLLNKGIGAFLPGGAINAGQAIVVRVTKPACDSTLSVLMKLIKRAGQSKPTLSLWADQVAAWFVAVLLLFAAIVLCTWTVMDPARAWPIAIAVLVVSCPCALSLATPTALATAADRLLRQGVLVIQPHVLETLHRVTHVIFDKTGTLTAGKPVLRRVVTLDTASSAWCLQVAAALEASNAHPLSAAIAAAARTVVMAQQAVVAGKLSSVAPEPMQAQSVVYVPGQGLEGQLNGVLYRLGRAAFVAELTGLTLAADENNTNDGTPVYLGCSNDWLARFELTDLIRSDARSVVQSFQASGKTVILLSGDQAGVAHQIAEKLGINESYGDYLPDQKLAFVQQLQRQGAVVAMVGDGINDAAVLRAADVSFAMGTGAALAQAQADAVLLSGRLSAVSDAATAAAQTMAVIRQNLIWASLYNLVAIPAAAIGLLNPWMTGIGMALSSALVVLNALRLRRIHQTVKAKPLQRKSGTQGLQGQKLDVSGFRPAGPHTSETA